MVRVQKFAYAVMEAVLERCCGLDVHKKTVTACLLVGPLDQPPRELVATFATTTKGLLELRDWLACYYADGQILTLLINLARTLGSSLVTLMRGLRGGSVAFRRLNDKTRQKQAAVEEVLHF